MNDPRAAFRIFAAAISTALTLTASFVLPDVPNEIWIAWSGVVMAGVGLGEVWFDRNTVHLSVVEPPV